MVYYKIGLVLTGRWGYSLVVLERYPICVSFTEDYYFNLLFR
jgi:hypothetical protein